MLRQSVSACFFSLLTTAGRCSCSFSVHSRVTWEMISMRRTRRGVPNESFDSVHLWMVHGQTTLIITCVMACCFSKGRFFDTAYWMLEMAFARAMGLWKETELGIYTAIFLATGVVLTCCLSNPYLSFLQLSVRLQVCIVHALSL